MKKILLVTIASLLMLVGTAFAYSIHDSFETLMSGAKNGDTNAIYALAQKCMLQGRGSEAMKWYETAAKKGHADSMSALGFWYGFYDVKDKSLYWYKESVKHGSRSGMRLLGEMYINGKNVPQNIPEGVRLISESASKGDTEACKILAQLYDTGIGVMQNHKEAEKWYKKASEGLPEYDKMQKIAGGFTVSSIAKSADGYIIVAKVEKGSIADKAGLLPGMEIVSYTSNIDGMGYVDAKSTDHQMLRNYVSNVASVKNRFDPPTLIIEVISLETGKPTKLYLDYSKFEFPGSRKK